jgi:hypothetical protein
MFLLPTSYETSVTESISSSAMEADRSMETKSPSSTARSTPTRLPKRSRSAVRRS